MSLPAPYYQDDFATIYHADCREILPYLPKVDLVLTDPPYGINYDTSHAKYNNGISRSIIKNDSEPFDPSHLLNIKDTKIILFGGNCFASKLPDWPGWISWIKTARDRSDIRQADMELAWTNFLRRPRTFHHLWIGAYKASESGERAQHPTQKPIQLMQWIIQIVDGANLILDPYVGSGTTLIAAKRLNRKCIGIELEEKYCEIAVKRLRQEVFNFAEVSA